MTGRTHKAGGCFAMLAAYMLMQARGFMPEIHPLVQLLVMYPAASWGSIMPDLDQNLSSIPEKTPFSIIVNRLLHLGSVKHRSWQTHSILTAGLFIGILYWLVYAARKNSLAGLDIPSCKLLTLLITGLAVGIGSHLLLDMMTYEGIQLIPGVWLRFFKLDIFRTGTAYEKIVRFALYLGCILSFLYICLSNAGILQQGG